VPHSLYIRFVLYLAITVKGDKMSANDKKKKYLKLEENGQIQIPVDFDEPGIPEEISTFLENHKPVLTFQFPKNKKNTMIINFVKKDGDVEKEDGVTVSTYDPEQVPSYIR
jgi:hypothetical protein